MDEFNDPRQSTTGCFKLECGHAYHTQCIFQYMRETEYQCLHCNVRRTPREEIELTGLIAQTIEELRSDPELRRLRDDFNEAMNEFIGVRGEVKRALEAAAPEIEARAGYHTIRREAMRRLQTLKKHIRAECLRRNPMTAGVWGIAGDDILRRAFASRPTRHLYSSYLYLTI